VHEAWRAAHGGTDPLHTPIDIAGVTEPHRVVPVTDGAARLASGSPPLLAGPEANWAVPRGRWGVWVSAPATEAGLDQADEAVARGLVAGACLVAVRDGTPLTRRLVCEAARLGRGAVTMLVEEGAPSEDVARTAVLSGRADLIGVRAMITPIADGTVPWPDDLARAYAKAGWWRGQSLGAEIAAVAEARKAATAVVDGATRISYASLAARADALAS